MRHYVYLFYRPEEEPYYVGITRHSHRAEKCWDRNNLCNRITNKIISSGRKPTRRIIICPDHKYACDLEMRIISHFGRLDNGTGILANLTDGGEQGTLGRIRSEAERQRIRERRLGSKASAETCDKMSITRTGKRHPIVQPLSDERKKTASETMRGNLHQKGKKRTPEQVRCKTDSQRMNKILREKGIYVPTKDQRRAMSKSERVDFYEDLIIRCEKIGVDYKPFVHVRDRRFDPDSTEMIKGSHTENLRKRRELS